MYGTAQFKLDRTCVQHGLDTTHFLFHMYACARKIDDVKPTMQSFHVRTRHVHNSLQMNACMSGMHIPNLDMYACKL